MSLDNNLLAASVLLLVSVLASKASAKLGIPALLLFLGIGMLAGSDGPGGIYFDDPRLAQTLGVVALAFILFAGGLETDWKSVHPVLAMALPLATVGVGITAGMMGWFVHYLFELPLTEGLLLGAVVASTDAAAVFAVMRSKNINLRGHLTPLIELESGSNDPMAVFLTIGLILVLVEPATTLRDLIALFIRQLVVGAILGYAMGRAGVTVINRLKLEYDGLYPVLTVSFVLLTYGLTASLGGSGFLAVYLAGLIIAKSDFVHKRSLTRFHDGTAWLMQIAMFLTLGLLVFPSRLPPVAIEGLSCALFLIFVARPVAVFLSLAWTRMGIKEKLMISWVGLRGAAPIILATFPLIAGIPRADMIFNIVFFIVLTSAALQGTSIPLVARWLGCDAPLVRKTSSPLEIVTQQGLTARLAEVAVANESAVVGKQIVDLGLPNGALIILMKRKDDFIVPTGATTIEPGVLYILADTEDLAVVQAMVNAVAKRYQVK